MVRALVLIDTQALQEDPQKMVGHEALVKAWLEGGLSDDIAAVVAHTILGDGWADAPLWQAKVEAGDCAQPVAVLHYPGQPR